MFVYLGTSETSRELFELRRPRPDPTPRTVMHELFLTAAVSNDDVKKGLQILQGYCAMPPLPLLRRRLFYKGPHVHNDGLNPQMIAAQGERVKAWNILNEELKRQAYIVVLLYNVTPEHFPKVGAPPERIVTINCDELLGTLIWNDLPDPAGTRPVNSRLTSVIDGCENLCNILECSAYRFGGEIVEEGYKFVHGNVEIYVTRYLDIPARYQEMEYEGKPKVNRRMPPYEALVPFDSENKWIMTATLKVMTANDLEYMKQGTDELMKIKADFEGCFDLQIRDRHIFDTRVKD